MILRNERGMTILEIMVVAGILAVVAVGLMQGVAYLQKSRNMTNDSMSKDRIVADLLDQIRGDLSSFQIRYDMIDPSSSVEKMTAENLPMAWSGSVMTEKERCPTCPGRFGYSIQPLSGYKGLFLVKVRLTHDELFRGQVKDYQFIVSGK